MKIWTIWLTAAIVTLIATGCSNDNADEPDYKSDDFINISLNENTRGIVESNNDFAIALFKEDITLNSNSNSCLSPFSIINILGMIANGDDGEIREEILKVLNLSNEESVDYMNAYFRQMLEILPTVGGSTTCTFHNSIWTDKNITFLPEFKNAMENFYFAEIMEKPESAREATEAVNNWVSKKTNGEIKDFLKEEFYQSWMLLNAGYFKGSWQTPFDKSMTTPGKFHDASGKECNAEFMHDERDLRYAVKNNYQEVRIDYGNGNFAMVLVLPDETESVASVARNLTASDISSFTESSEIFSVKIALPKFEIDSKQQIDDLLGKVGITAMYRNNLNSMFTTASGSVNNILHESKIKVDEEGTVAAAATGGVLTSSNFTVNSAEMIFDRPFMFFILETSTNTILYTGQVNNL